ncbi:MAG: Armadillo repeat-containing protein 4 [Paramarteilia canceri]
MKEKQELNQNIDAKINSDIKGEQLKSEDCDNLSESSEESSSVDSDSDLDHTEQQPWSFLMRVTDEDLSENESNDRKEKGFNIPKSDSSSRELSSGYWQIQKLIKFMRVGNQTATPIALCSINNMNFSTSHVQASLKDFNATETLLNIADTEHLQSKTAALRILAKMSRYTIFRRIMIEMSALDTITNAIKCTNNLTRFLSIFSL